MTFYHKCVGVVGLNDIPGGGYSRDSRISILENMLKVGFLDRRFGIVAHLVGIISGTQKKEKNVL